LESTYSGKIFTLSGIPEVPQHIPVEAEKRMIRRPPLFWIVTNTSHLVFSKEDKNGGVQIEDHSGRGRGF
jgi:hypothetical protein